MKGFLKCTDGGLFQLAPKVTTIGREGCDLVVQTPAVDFQHAVIEFSSNEECFVLQDLNTTHGTYVNDCRVQNAAVRLAPGDIIRFGTGSYNYELNVENPTQITYPPVQQRTAWSGPLTVIDDQNQPPPPIYATESLPHLQQFAKPPTTSWGAASTASNSTLPRPPTATMRSRPLSAGSVVARNRTVDKGTAQAGWVSTGSPARTILTNGSTDNVNIAQEKEQRILRLTEEVRRLAMYETECTRKEELVQTLREEIADLQGRLRQIETARSAIAAGGSKDDIINKQENDLKQKQLEINSLREQINRMRSGGGGSDTGPISREDFNQRVVEVNNLRSEMERIKKDKNLTSGLVTQMQRDMANKDSTISRMTRELENIKKEVKDKDAQLLAMQTKFKRVEDNRKVEEEIDAKEKEIATLKLKMKSTDNRVQEQSDLIAALKQEVEQMRKTAEESREAHKKLVADLDGSKSSCLDLERAERQVRVDLQQQSVKLERMRERVMQVTYSTPGIKAPKDMLGDDELVEALKKVVGERTELFKQVKDLKDNLQLANSVKREVTEGSKKLKQQLNESTSRLKTNGFISSQIKHEVDLVSAVTVTEGATWLKDICIDLLKSILVWEADIEKALQECGINVKISDRGPAEHVGYLRQRGFDLKEERDRLEEMLENLRVSSQNEKDEALRNLRSEYENTSTDQIERAKLQAEEQMNRAIDEIRLLEEQKRDAAIFSEKNKVTELEVTISGLKQSIEEKEEEYQRHRETARVALEELEYAKKAEADLQRRVHDLEIQVEESGSHVTKHTELALSKQRDEVLNYQEQLKQHSLTICSMEERLNQLVKKNKDYQAEITQLHSQLQETKLRPKPPAAPKPKVIVQKPAQDVTGLEQIIEQLRKESVDLKKKVADQQTVISGLRRDLTGASAKLSDMTGELTEKQKEQMEKTRVTLERKEAELVDAQGKLAKLSTITDKQSKEVKKLKDDISKQSSALSKMKNTMNQKETIISQLEEKVELEREQQKSRLDTLQEEGRITSELSALGAQCRGERHDQVITRQREALTELRMRIRVLEQCNPQVPSHDQALQQVMLLKKELAELRARDALNENSMIQDAVSDRRLAQARGVTASAASEQSMVDVERSAHRETMESLEYSENSYLTLLRSVSTAIDLHEVPGLRSMAHIHRDEREKLFTEREQVCEMLASRVKVLHERIQRKDELLQGYEKDLTKLRQAEMLAETRQSQLDGLSTDVRGKMEETQYLREALQRTRERLEQEKRLNVAIKSKKTFHLENERAVTARSRKPHCEIEDPLDKRDQKRREKQERAKRKNYEIKILKSELSQKEHELTSARKSIMGLQSTTAHGSRLSYSAPRLDSPTLYDGEPAPEALVVPPPAQTPPRTQTPPPLLQTPPPLFQSQSKSKHLMFRSSPHIGDVGYGAGSSGRTEEEEEGLEAGEGDEGGVSGDPHTFSAISSSVLTESVSDTADLVL